MIWLLLASFLFAAEAFAAGDALRGKVVAEVRCGPCHRLDSIYLKVGPGLLGIFGAIPTITGVPFDRWDREALQIWLTDPRKVKRNTRMLLPYLPERDRNDIITWLASQKQ